MYRPPEIVDPFKKFKVSKQVDIWMLGCVLYTLVYFTHPFIDASKAGISDAAFRLNKEKCSEKINDLIRNMLTPNPENRVTVDQILLIISNWNTYTQIPLNVVSLLFRNKPRNSRNNLSRRNRSSLSTRRKQWGMMMTFQSKS